MRVIGENILNDRNSVQDSNSLGRPNIVATRRGSDQFRKHTVMGYRREPESRAWFLERITNRIWKLKWWRLRKKKEKLRLLQSRGRLSNRSECYKARVLEPAAISIASLEKKHPSIAYATLTAEENSDWTGHTYTSLLSWQEYNESVVFSSMLYVKINPEGSSE